jgi:hypothetical protein
MRGGGDMKVRPSSPIALKKPFHTGGMVTVVVGDQNVCGPASRQLPGLFGNPTRTLGGLKGFYNQDSIPTRDDPAIRYGGIVPAQRCGDEGP